MTPVTTDASITSELIDETTEAVLGRGLSTDLMVDEVHPEDVINTPMPSATRAVKPQGGFRTVGPKKLNMINKLAAQISRLTAKGINTDYILKKFTKWRGPIKTPTKQISGVISTLKEFENA